MKQNFLLKSFVLLIALLAGGISASWGQTTLFTTNFSTDDGWSTEDIITSETTEATKTIKGTTISFKGYKSSNLKVIVGETASAAGKLTFTGNNLSASNGSVNYYMAIPVSGVNGTLTIATTGDATKWYYSYKDGNGNPVDRQQASANNGFTIENLTNSDVVVYIGSSGKNMTSITITTPESESAEKFAVTYAAGDGTGTMEGEEYAEGKTFTLPTCTFTAPEGKSFVGWLCSADNEVYDAGATYTMTGIATTFTAQYAKVANKIIYSLIDRVGSAEVSATDATVNEGTSLVLSNTSGRIKLTAASGEQFKDGDKVVFSGMIGKTEKNYGVKYGSTTSINNGSLFVAGTTDPLSVTGSLSLSSATSDLYIGRYDGTTTTLTSLVISRQLAIQSEAFGGVMIEGSKATENTDYTIDGTTITLVGSYTAAPEVALIETLTAIDNSTFENNVSVELTKSGSLYTGTATVAGVTYTVNATVNTSAELIADETALTVTSPKIATGSVTFNLTGNNLVGESVSIDLESAVEGLSINPTTIDIIEGAVSQEVKVTYQSDVEVASTTVNLIITATGVDNIVIPVTYSSTAGVTEITDVTEATTWDWSNTGLDETAVSPNQNAVVVLANVDGWSENFNAAALAGQAQYFYYGSNNCFQGSILKFHTTVPGTVTVEYSNTGNRTDEAANYRYLYINDVKADQTGSISASSKNTVEDYPVAAGDVVLKGIQGEDTQNMLRIYKVVFTPGATITATKEYSTFCSAYDLDFTEVDGLEAYVVSAIGESSATITKVNKVPARTGLILKKTADVGTATTFNVSIASSTDDMGTNYMVGVTEATDISSISNAYILSDGKFYKSNGGILAAGKAYLVAEAWVTSDAPSFSLNVDDEGTTGIRSIDNGQLTIDNVYYDLSGRRVAQPSKGVYIVNGKKVVIK